MMRGLSVVFFSIVTGAMAQTFEVFDPNTAGIPTVSITAIDEDSEGNMWVGTEGGLCKYDGTSWTVLQTGNSGLPHDQVTAVAVDTADNVWVGTVLGGLAVFDGNAGWTYFNTTNSPLPDDQILSLTIDHRNWVWIGTFLGLMCYTGSEWHLYNDQPTSYNGLVMTGSVIRDVAVRADGLVAIGTLNGGFHYMTEDIIEAHATFIDLFFDNTQNGVVFDTIHDERWLATPSQGLLRNFGDWQGGFWFQYSVWNSSIPSNSLLCVAMDEQGRPWVGSVDAGVIVKNTDDSFLFYNTSNSGMPDDGVTCLHFAADGALWIGTYGGGAVRMTMSNWIVERDDRIFLHPNPAADHCTVRTTLSGDAPAKWQLFNAQGALVLAGTSRSNTFHIDVSALAQGVHSLVLLGSQVKATARLVKY